MKPDEISRRWPDLWAVATLQQRELLARATEEEIAAAIALFEITNANDTPQWPLLIERILRGILPKRPRGMIRCPRCSAMMPAPNWSFHVC